MPTEYVVDRSQFTTIPSHILGDGTLSLNAISILARGIAWGSGKKQGYRQFLNQGISQSRVRSALRELEHAGLRHRFRIRYKDGSLREIVYITPTPQHPDQAFSKITTTPGYDIVDVTSDIDIANNIWQTYYPNESPRMPEQLCHQPGEETHDTIPFDSNDAATCTDNPPAPSQEQHTPGRVTTTDTTDSDDAQQDDDGTYEVTYYQPNDTPTPAKTQETPSDTESDADFSLCYQAIPENMRYIPATSMRSVARLIRERLDAGWTIKQIHEILAARRLPQHVRSYPALIIHRLQHDIPVDHVPPRVTDAGFQTNIDTTTLSDGTVIEYCDIDWTEASVELNEDVGAKRKRWSRADYLAWITENATRERYLKPHKDRSHSDTYRHTVSQQRVEAAQEEETRKRREHELQQVWSKRYREARQRAIADYLYDQGFTPDTGSWKAIEQRLNETLAQSSRGIADIHPIHQKIGRNWQEYALKQQQRNKQDPDNS